MGVRKRGKLYEAWIRVKDEHTLILGKFDCRRCASIAVEAAERCIGFGGYECRSPESIDLVRRMDVIDVIEDYLGTELSEERALYEDKKLIEELVKYRVESVLQKKTEQELKKKQYYTAHRLLKAVPLCEVPYPAVNLINPVSPTDTGDGIPATSGVYFVWHLGTVEYVGQSVNLKNRVRLSHEKIWANDLITWLEYSPSVLNYAESFYIGICMPSRNFGKFQKRIDEKENGTGKKANAIIKKIYESGDSPE